MSSSNQDIAYLVPKTLWERTLQAAKQNKSQSGGALAGIDKSGDVDSKKIMQMMAIQQNLGQAPNLNFVGHADKLMKQILDHPHLSNEDKIQFLTSAQDAYERQRRSGFTADDEPKPPPPPPSLPPPPPLPAKTNYFTPTKIKKTSPSFRPTPSFKPSFKPTPASIERKIQLVEKKMAQIEQSPNVSKKQKQELKKKLNARLRTLRSGKEY